MKKVSLSVAARAYAAGRTVFFASGEGVALMRGTCSVAYARRKLMRVCQLLLAEGYYLEE